MCCHQVDNAPHYFIVDGPPTASLRDHHRHNGVAKDNLGLVTDANYIVGMLIARLPPSSDFDRMDELSLHVE